ncbi:hypothetical protein SAMN05445756_1558 [Kytococcus aerolatus]|uniref:Antitoxin FitA-like ribbon-helix-helix domain-containing protein n=1 Tax=Kytococcus aerolatus TaxID=592308 RepID=A0A212U0F9_9MICO|nr:antitoxin [Kytococcus aerolatus]SNC71616.1 hypothetical protein SAMN05445756_1558 [Kytococcus aerolatus]
MKTLYVRDVPDDVAERLKERAAAAGQSLSAYVAGQLTTLASRPTNAEVAQRLHARQRDEGLSREEVVERVAASRR